MNRFLPIVVSLVLALFVTTLSAAEIRCEGDYQYHLQGFASDGQSIFWTFTNVLVKTDMNGKKLQEVPVPSHHGDCCVVDGKVYVGTHLAWPSKGRTSWIYVYNCSDLSFVEKFNIPEYDYDGVDGITFKDGFFYVCVGKDPDNPRPYNIILKMTPKFEKVAEFHLDGKTTYGVQTLTWSGGYFWAGTYSDLNTIQADENFNVVSTKNRGFSVGLFGLPASEKGEPRLMGAIHHRDEETKRNSATAVSVVFRDGKLIED